MPQLLCIWGGVIKVSIFIMLMLRYLIHSHVYLLGRQWDMSLIKRESTGAEAKIWGSLAYRWYLKPCDLLWTECVTFKFICWISNLQYDGIWRLDLSEVISFRRVTRARPSWWNYCISLCACTKETSWEDTTKERLSPCLHPDLGPPDFWTLRNKCCLSHQA